MLYLAAKPSHVGGDVDGIAYSMHRPMAYICQRCGQSFLTGTAPSCHARVGGGAFLGDLKLPGLDIYRGVDCLDTCETESHMENFAFTRACLFDVRVIMGIMPVPLGELLC
jgi:hypothetical protein